jgi:Sulfatase
MKRTGRVILVLATAFTILGLAAAPTAFAQQKKPNILVIWGDDIRQSNLSVYTKGLMGYKTPNIDRIASEGMLFTDYYGEQSCTAGRAAFIMGQSVFRSGLSKVGLPGAAMGMRAEDPTIAELQKRTVSWDAGSSCYRPRFERVALRMGRSRLLPN